MEQRDLELRDRITNLENEIVDELDRLLRAYMVNLAVAHPVPGYDVDDLLQEMRYKMWDKIRIGKFDPERTKPITYFSWVFRTTLYNLRRSSGCDRWIDAYNFSDSIDALMEDLEQESRYLKHHNHMTFCDICARIIDPHSNWQVFTRRETDPTLMCEACIIEANEREAQKAGEYT